MTMAPKPRATPIDRLLRAYRRDPRKVSAVAGLSLVMAVLWGRMLMTGPGPATAGTPQASGTLVLPKKPPAASGSPADVALLQWLDTPRPVVARNLFGIDTEAFPKPVPAANTGRADSSEPAGKSGGSGADDHSEQLAEDANKAEAAKFKLESTLLGLHPLAVVNGQLVGEGDDLGSFKIERIQARRVTLVHDQQRIDLTMD
jgi:hypothetical protein